MAPGAGSPQGMTAKDTAVMFYVLGLLTGIIVAFASCAADNSGGSSPAPPPAGQLNRLDTPLPR